MLEEIWESSIEGVFIKEGDIIRVDEERADPYDLEGAFGDIGIEFRVVSIKQTPYEVEATLKDVSDLTNIRTWYPESPPFRFWEVLNSPPRRLESLFDIWEGQ